MIRICAYHKHCSMRKHLLTQVHKEDSNPLRKHAYSNILKILQPKKENFQMRNSDIFPISSQNIDFGYSPQSIFFSKIRKTRGPRATHLSDIATADMQMLCNIFPVLSSQLMKRSTFKQFLILKKNIIYGMTVNGA